jgi:hypothetical protein
VESIINLISKISNPTDDQSTIPYFNVTVLGVALTT